MRLEVYSMQFAACKSKWFIFLSEKNKQTALILIQGVKRVNETISFFIAVFNPVECKICIIPPQRSGSSLLSIPGAALVQC